jgi:hypothetical protein
MKRYKAMAIVPLTITSDRKLDDEDKNDVLRTVKDQMSVSISTISDFNMLEITKKGDITVVYL